MSKLIVTTTGGQPSVVPTPGAGISTPPVYLVSNSQNYLAYNFAQSLTPWVNNLILTYGIPVQATAGPMIFSSPAVTIDSGNYVVVIDATVINQPATGFNGFDVEVSISANPPNDPTSQSSSIYAATLLPNGNSTFTPVYFDGTNIIVSVPILANSQPTLAPNDPNFATTLQYALNQLNSLTGGITVLTAAGPQQSVIGGPYFVQFNNPGARRLLTFKTTNGLTVATARVVAGSVSVQEIQQIILNRPMTAVKLNVTAPILYDGTTHTWTIQVYLTNPYTSAQLPVYLAIHNMWLYRIASQLYQVTVGDNVINVGKLDLTPGTATPLNAPGGFRTRAAQDASVNYDHETYVYAGSALAGSSGASPLFPASNLITGSSADRLDSVIIRTDLQLADAPAPGPLAPNKVRILVDNGQAFDPNNPPYINVTTLARDLADGQSVGMELLSATSINGFVLESLADPGPSLSMGLSQAVYSDGFVFEDSTDLASVTLGLTSASVTGPFYYAAAERFNSVATSLVNSKVFSQVYQSQTEAMTNAGMALISAHVP